MSVRRRNALALAAFTLSACSLPSQNKPAAVRFHGEAADPIADTASVADVSVARPPDLVYASVQVTNDALRLIIRFAPASLDTNSTGAMILLDTDLDLETGVRDPDLGVDYLVSVEAGPRREATIARAVTDPSCASPLVPCRYEPIGRAKVALSSDEMAVSLPRSAFARFDGTLNFRVISYAILNSGRETRTTDHMPNAPGRFIEVR